MLDAKFIAADIAKTKAALAPGQILMVSGIPRSFPSRNGFYIIFLFF